MNNLNYFSLEKLTLVIFTFNRHSLLVRTLNYWSNYNIKLIVLDGSSMRLKNRCLQSKNIKYIYDTRGLYERLLSSVNHIDTEFVILGSDDEFYLPSALESCIKFLLKEPTFTSCGGRAIGFISDKGKILGVKQYTRLKNFCLDNQNGNLRALMHFSNYVPAHFYSVMRSSIWNKISKYVFEKNYELSAAHELQLEYLATIAGKSKIIPELLWLRNKGVPPINNFEMKKVEKRQWWFDNKYQLEKDDFIKRMKQASNELLNDQNYELDDDLISKSFEAYLHNLKFQDSSLRKLVRLMPHQIKLIIKSIFSFKYKYITNKYESLKDEVSLLETNGVYVNQKELDFVISVLEYSENKNL